MVTRNRTLTPRASGDTSRRECASDKSYVLILRVIADVNGPCAQARR